MLSSLVLCSPACAQNTIGIPIIKNYPKQTYSAGSQNWGIAQDKAGILYFANNQGLLSFDGTFWRKYLLPNKTIVRSVAVSPDGRIYVGGQSEFGYFFPGKNGDLAYTSLIPLLQEKAKDFTDVWNICFFQDRVFFRSYRKLLEYDNQKIIVHDGINWNFLGIAGSRLLAFEYGRGLVYYDKGKWATFVKHGALATDVNIKSALSIGRDSTLLVTLTQGLYILKSDSIAPFKTKYIETIAGENIYGASVLAQDRVALITNLSGCIIINTKGELIQRFSKKEGIQSNNILSLMLDKDSNLWLGLDNGIDLVLYNNSIKNIFPEYDDRNAGYASILYNNRLYLGLTSGAYAINLKGDADLSYTKGVFELVTNSKGQVWNFSTVNNRLLMARNSGAYLVENSFASLLDSTTGFWNFQSLTAARPSERMLAGTYNGINLYTYNNDGFSSASQHIHFESARFIVQHNKDIWIAHPFKGLYRVDFTAAGNPVATVYKDKNNILSANHNKIFEVAGKMLLTTDKGIFEFDDAIGDFVRSSYYETIFGGSPVSYMKEDKYGNLWFSRDKKIGVIDKVSGKTKVVFIPELNNLIQADGFENINIIDSNNILIAGEKGFFHLNYSQYKKSHYPLQVLVRNVRSVSDKDSLLYGGYGNLQKSPELNFAYNSLHFECASTIFGENTIEYSFLLEGFDRGWSVWSSKTEKEYTNLPPGFYRFKVRCRNNFDNESPEAAFSFTILPPWYRTWWAYCSYGILLFASLYFFYKRQQRKYKRQQQQKLLDQQRKYAEEQKRLQVLHQLELAESEKLIAQLQQEKLQAEVEHKNTELASSAMNIVHKAEILSKLKEDLIQLKESAEIEKGAKEFQKIIKRIDGELDHAGEWEQFARHFDNVHNDYLKKLKSYYSDLTTSDLKLAAYLRLNLSTKEIAQLMNISVRGVETSRYRLRKKLGLTSDEKNLYNFLIKIAES